MRLVEGLVLEGRMLKYVECCYGWFTEGESLGMLELEGYLSRVRSGMGDVYEEGLVLLYFVLFGEKIFLRFFCYRVLGCFFYEGFLGLVSFWGGICFSTIL